MVLFTLRKVAVLIGTMLGLAALTFIITNVAPGDPARLVAGPDATNDMVETIRREYGLDRPLIEQFLIYMGDLLTAIWAARSCPPAPSWRTRALCARDAGACARRHGARHSHRRAVWDAVCGLQGSLYRPSDTHPLDLRCRTAGLLVRHPAAAVLRGAS